MLRQIENHFKIIAFALFIAYVLYRLPSFDADVAETGALAHDSAYMMIVARNLLGGLGFINQAHWLIFLNPDQLPMPYHNANPLFPLLVAIISGTTGISTPLAGVLISLAGHLILLVSVYSMARTANWTKWQSLGVACLCAVLQPQWQESLPALPDSLATGLMFAMFAVAIRPGTDAKWWIAGFLLGLSWLTRTTILLVMPGFFLWCWHNFGLKQTTKKFSMMAVPAIVVASPWLWHTWMVWGNPLRSDAAYYWFQDYYAHIAGYGVGEYWRSVQPPPSIKAAVLSNPLDFFVYWMKGIPRSIYNWISLWNHASKPAAIVFLMALGCGAWAARSWWKHSLFWMCGFTGMLTFLSMGVRPDTVELRYLDPVNVVLTFLLMAPLTVVGDWNRRLLLGIPLAAYLVLFTLPQDLSLYQFNRTVNPKLTPLRKASLEMAKLLPPDATVISPLPYFTSFFSKLKVIAPPYPGTETLLTVMEKYRANYLLLPKMEMGQLYSGAPASIELYFVLKQDYGDYVLYERLVRQTPNTLLPNR